MDEMLFGLVLTDMGDGHETGVAALVASLLALPSNATAQSLARGLTTGLTAGPIVHKRIGAGTSAGMIRDVPKSLLLSSGPG
jgi:hypothetical protein